METAANKRSCHRLTEEELQDLIKRWKQGDRSARAQLIQSHLYVVNYLIPKYLDQGVEWDDLYQEGCYGLICAIDRYDPDKGASIATYAHSWIEKYLKCCIQKQNIENPIIISEDIYYALKRYHRAYSDLCCQLERDPTDSEIAQYMNQTPEELRKLKEFIYIYLPLDKGFGNKKTPPENYLIPRYKLPPSAESIVLDNLCPLDLSQYNVMLTKREEESLRQRLGFTTEGIPKTFKEISAATGWSEETIRADYYRALTKIRAGIASKQQDK